MTTPKNNSSAIQQFVETFGSVDELMELFDNLLTRIVFAYSGSAQPNYNLVGDYDFIQQLKQALKADLGTQCLQYAEGATYAKSKNSSQSPHATSAAQALKIAEGQGITDFSVTKVNNEYVLLTHWTQSEVTAYQNNTSQTLWGSFSDEGVFMVRFLNLMTP